MDLYNETRSAVLHGKDKYMFSSDYTDYTDYPDYTDKIHEKNTEEY